MGISIIAEKLENFLFFLNYLYLCTPFVEGDLLRYGVMAARQILAL